MQSPELPKSYFNVRVLSVYCNVLIRIHQSVGHIIRYIII